MSGIKWNEIFKKLEKWRADTSAEDPSVSTVSDHYQRDPWAILVSTIISLRTKDEVTIVASERLLEKAPGPAELAALKQEKIEKLIYPAGFYRNKAISLKKIASILLKQYNGKVPSSMEALLVGPPPSLPRTSSTLFPLMCNLTRLLSSSLIHSSARAYRE